MGDFYIKFLGTAGARFVVGRQLRASGGVFINICGKKIILDPGPGALVRCVNSKPKIDPFDLDGIILSHSHIDHCNDVNILIDAMTNGGLLRKGALFAPKEALYGENRVVFDYLRDFLERIEILSEKSSYDFFGAKLRTSVRHRHPVETYGIILEYKNKRVSFIVDTEFFEELIESYKDSDILIINVVRYKEAKNKNIMHLNVDDVCKILSAIKPKSVFLTHFGMTMLRAKPHIVAKELSDKFGIEVKAATDGMRVDIV